MVLDSEGQSIWERLHGRHRLKDPARIARAAIEEPAVIFAFDLLWLNGADFRPRTLLQRKDALHRLLPANRRILYATHIPDTCAELCRLANAMDLEGPIAKRADSTYTLGARTYGRTSKQPRAWSANSTGADSSAHVQCYVASNINQEPKYGE